MSYVDRIIQQVEEKDGDEPEFLQCVKEVLNSLRPVVESDEKYEKAGILERLVEPEKSVVFRVPWVDDQGRVRVNRGYRIQFSSSIGPYKGGLRFQPNVNSSVIKFLGFEQIFKNSLTGMPIGGGKGGADFDPKGKSEAEIMRFCQSYMTELFRYIGPDTDCPAGDMGVGAREIGYMYGQYKRICGSYKAGALSGKGLSYGGSIGRMEATGYGAVYFTQEYFKTIGRQIKDTVFAVSGFGNVAWGVVKKIDELGGKVVTLSGPDGYIYDPDGVTGEKIDYMLEMRTSNKDCVKDYAKKFHAEFYPGEKPWGKVKADVYMPCATQNEIHEEDAKRILEEGHSRILIEVANMPTTQEAMDLLMEKGVTVLPSKAVNAGGVAVSSLEMVQNAEHLSWKKEEVDERLHDIMKDIFCNIDKAAKKYGCPGNYVAGANLAGFEKVADAMLCQGIC
ncbi:MAG: NADP-specific glutamate dehydrogenase [Eubacteriales bacterium]|nr:NADP-specific glutamate dehydrogenase [Eubacteriales bacterium]